jgi:addiction module RelE/StbE family toxin
MSYNIKIEEHAIKSLKKVSEPYSGLIKKKINLLKEFSSAISNVKALQGEYRGLYRLRVSNYRVLFEVKEKTITILDIFSRGQGY